MMLLGESLVKSDTLYFGLIENYNPLDVLESFGKNVRFLTVSTEGSSVMENTAREVGFLYLKASNKEEFNTLISEFTKPESIERPILFEVLIDKEEDAKTNAAITLLLNNRDTESDSVLSKGMSYLKKLIKR